ncbi:unnamed protein product [Alopecurus aequalis]
MPPQSINPTTLEDAVQLIIPYLEDTRSSAHRAIYWEGWRGLAASAVLRAIANNPPPSLRKKFNKIIHVDCSRWKSRRELQRTIARELELPHRVMDVFDMQDEEDDFRGVDESFRAEIGSVGTEIFQALMGHRCLVTEFHQSYGTILDMRFFQTLVLQSNLDLCWKSTRFHLNLCIPCTDKVEEEESDKKMTDHGSSGQLIGLPRPKLLIPNNGSAYSDVYIETMTTGQDYNSSPQLKPSGYHVEIGEGISNISVESLQGMNAIMFVMNKAVSLHVHDNSSITTVIPENMIYVDGKILTWDDLQECYVVRCSNMHTVFVTNYARYCFEKIETFWAANLLMAHCIWSKGRMDFNEDTRSFAKLRTIHLYSCPRLTFVLPLSWAALGSYLPNLETLHIVNCGDLKDVLPVEPEFLTKISTDHRRDVLEFPKLKQIYLHELYKLQHICEAKMFAPRLETVRLRGCWGLRRLPAVGRGNRRRPVVECEKDWWENLEWDGLADGHHPILFEPHHSSYYKKPLPRVSVLR